MAATVTAAETAEPAAAAALHTTDVTDAHAAVWHVADSNAVGVASGAKSRPGTVTAVPLDATALDGRVKDAAGAAGGHCK